RVTRPLISTLGSIVASIVFGPATVTLFERTCFVANPSRRSVKSCVPSTTRTVNVPSLAERTDSSSACAAPAPIMMRCIMPRPPVGLSVDVTDAGKRLAVAIGYLSGHGDAAWNRQHDVRLALAGR